MTLDLELDPLNFESFIVELISKEENIPFETHFESKTNRKHFDAVRSERRSVIELKASKINEHELYNSYMSRVQSLLNQYSDIDYLILVFNQIISPQKKKILERDLKFNRRLEIKFYDSTDLIELIKDNKSLLHKYIIPWHLAFSQLNELLNKFATKCSEQNKTPGIELYKISMAEKTFVSQNRWIKKFEKDFGIRSVDPMHIFFSFNGSKMKYSTRKNRINLWIKILGGDPIETRIAFKGCPSPTIVSTMGVRKIEQQVEIWQVFKILVENDSIGTKEKKFRKFENWYGVRLSAFSMFLFWVKSDRYFPLDKHVKTYLKASFRSISIPDKLSSYLKLSKTLGRYNERYSDNFKFGQYGLFRELSYVAYETVSSGNIDLYISEGFQSFNSDSINVSESKFKHNKQDSSKTDYTHEQGFEITKKGKQLGFSPKEYSNLNFKLIALKPLDSCIKEHLGNLNPGDLYYFEKTISITPEKIFYHPEKNIRLYSKPFETSINVTSIVGKNGSGKSSLIELLFRTINNVSYARRKNLPDTKISKLKGLNVELFYVFDYSLYKLESIDGRAFITEYHLNTNSNQFEMAIAKRGFLKKDLSRFFYSIGVNYSTYSLNSVELGDWVAKLFHKNDGYQTPVVINPMRKDGIIDINKENKLLNSRLIANILSPVAEGDIGMRQVTDSQKVKKIEYRLIEDKNVVLYHDKDGNEILFNDFTGDVDTVIDIVKEIFGFENKRKKLKVEKEIRKYIVRKLVRIAIIYFQKDEIFDKVVNNFKSETDLRNYVLDLKLNPSHITFKLSQAINYYKYSSGTEGLWPVEKTFNIEVKDSSERLENFMRSIEANEVMEFIPPPIFRSVIYLVDDKEEISPFYKLSSGEKQLIHSTSSILYHLKNIDSVSGKTTVKYSAINLLLDEIELYYHPELQKKYLNYLLKMIKRINIPSIDAINICLITHSPYILSDIPTVFTLHLGTDESIISKTNTFGANIHDLLANNFFMKEGYIGDLAMIKIQETITFLEYKQISKEIDQLNSNIDMERSKEEKERSEVLVEKYGRRIKELEKELLNIDMNDVIEDIGYYEKIINLIGEPILQDKLNSMLLPFISEEKRKENIKRKISEILIKEGINADFSFN